MVIYRPSTHTVHITRATLTPCEHTNTHTQKHPNAEQYIYTDIRRQTATSWRVWITFFVHLYPHPPTPLASQDRHGRRDTCLIRTTLCQPPTWRACSSLKMRAHKMYAPHVPTAYWWPGVRSNAFSVLVIWLVCVSVKRFATLAEIKCRTKQNYCRVHHSIELLGRKSQARVIWKLFR